MAARFSALLAAVTALFLCVTAYAAEGALSAAVSIDEGEPKSVVELTVDCAELYSQSAELVRTEFDTEVFEFVRVSEKPENADTDVVVAAGGWVDACFVSDGENAAQGRLALLFRVRDTAPAGESVITVSRLAAGGESAVTELPFTVLPPPSSESALTVLFTEAGELVPSFSSDCLNYSLSVSSEIDTVEFSTVPSEGATCKVNRKKLSAAGSKTDFKITVTAADGKTKSVYTVQVYRSEKSPSPSQSPPPSPTPTPTAQTPQSSAASPPLSMPTAEPSASATPTITTSPTHSSSPTAAAIPPAQSVNNAAANAPLVVRSGTNFLPFAAAVIVIIASIGVSRPLARLVCAPKSHRKNRKK